MLNAGWHAHTLNAPGKFLIAVAEHATPMRARAYLITDQVVADTAERFAGLRPPLDQVSQRATDQDHSPERIAATPDVGTVTPGDAGTSPDGML
jgi:S-DNA-T family DNA segregation ATPase FtsK/SpoIIIE